ncbi:hypothetical protein M422DRAFT_262755 [Sphaerobolus stellatus SS14]|uniref:Zn(2)-C6 fungal-type domain-containing protein n=1 Tax=Sphaerobolus stellatus (strain SS14) TaxID=990650 RepID=A0A0C9UJH5_SPHS4|nr:hypothetical protein M422DRAFT_262755 [Sphaerobolus stellatus SS14]
MSSSSKPTMANTVLYKKSKDVPILPPIRSTDARRMLDGFQAVPKFKGRRDPSKGETWAEADTDERSSIVAGYWRAYDKDYADLNKLFLSLKKKEDMVAELKRKAEEAQKKEVVMPVASGSGKGKGKLKEVVLDTDLESKVEEEFRETCLNCDKNKVKCVFMHPTAGKKSSCDRCVHQKVNCTYRSPYEWALHGALKMANGHIKSLKAEVEDRNMLAGEELYHKYNLQQLESLRWAHSVFLEVARLDVGLQELELKLKVVDQMVPEDLFDDTEQGRVWIISKHNYIVRNCAFNMKQLAAWYVLGTGHEAKALLMDARGGIEVADVTESGKKRSRDGKDAGPGSSKKARVEEEVVRKEGQGSGEKEKRVEVEKEAESAPNMVGGLEKGKEKEKDTGSEITDENTMKE